MGYPSRIAVLTLTIPYCIIDLSDNDSLLDKQCLYPMKTIFYVTFSLFWDMGFSSQFTVIWVGFEAGCGRIPVK